MMSLFVLSVTATAQTTLYPSHLYPGVSWEMQPVAPQSDALKYQFRQDETIKPKEKPQQWAVPDVNQPRYRPLNTKEVEKPIHDYQYRSEIPDAVLDQAYNTSEFKQGLSDDTIGQQKFAPFDYQSGFTNENPNPTYYRLEQTSEFKQGLPDYQPKPLPEYTNTYGHSAAYPTQSYTQPVYPQANYHPSYSMDNYYMAQPYNPWNPQQQFTQPQQQQANPWQASQYMYQNMMQAMPNLPDVNTDLPTLPLDSQFYFQQNSPFQNYHSQQQQSRELPFSPEQVFIVPSHWIQPPNQENTNNTAQFTVYPIEQTPADLPEMW